MVYFVVALHPNTGFPVPIMENEYDVAVYETREKAKAMAEDQPFCAAAGYEIVEWRYYEMEVAK